jgi:hypothetical protein
MEGRACSPKMQADQQFCWKLPEPRTIGTDLAKVFGLRMPSDESRTAEVFHLCIRYSSFDILRFYSSLEIEDKPTWKPGSSAEEPSWISTLQDPCCGINHMMKRSSPPIRSTILPVIYPALSETIKAIASATSCGVAARRNAIFFSIVFRTSSEIGSS